jgi:hypothetical protein
MTDALLEISSVFLLHMQVRVDQLTIVSETTSSKPSVTKTALSNLLMAKSGGITLHPSSEKPVDSNKVSQLAQRQSSIPPNQWTVDSTMEENLHLQLQFLL